MTAIDFAARGLAARALAQLRRNIFTRQSHPAPGADRIPFWNNDAGAVSWLEAGNGLSLEDNVLSTTGPGWTPIGAAAPNGAPFVEFTDIPQGHSDLFIELNGISHDGPSQTLDIAVSDGATFSAGVPISGALGTGAHVGAGFAIPGYTRDVTSLTVRLDSLSPSPSLNGNGNGYFRIIACTGGIRGLRFQWAEGASFDAGSIALHAR
ncbi:hypothetical protein MB02_08645 [Croceicoccus estronivorus]|uniref:hypothetical protein n=1 Tax=Croceicoccus estronivorus TaxID=1172626 RepID=UPI000832C644|nr:hypothetical protein [Croceicoccus estronivorus]OCC23881.1 hypothetical protein MB02_08645 [Croceicoccus estronivorus]